MEEYPGLLEIIIVKWICIYKDEDGKKIRPLVITSVHKRAIGNIYNKLSADAVRNATVPLNLGGAGISGGIDAIIHSTRILSRLYESDTDKGIVTLDLANAYNNINRLWLRKIIKDKIPICLPYFDLCYSKPTTIYLHFDDPQEHRRNFEYNQSQLHKTKHTQIGINNSNTDMEIMEEDEDMKRMDLDDDDEVLINMITNDGGNKDEGDISQEIHTAAKEDIQLSDIPNAKGILLTARNGLLQGDPPSGGYLVLVPLD